MMGMMARGNEIYRFNKEVHIRIDGIKPNKLKERGTGQSQSWRINAFT